MSVFVFSVAVAMNTTCFFCRVLFEEEEPSPSLSADLASSGFSADGDSPTTSSSYAFSTVFWDELPSSETSFIPSPLFRDGGGEQASFFTSWISSGSIVAGVTPPIMSSSSSLLFSPFSHLTTASMVSTYVTSRTKPSTELSTESSVLIMSIFCSGISPNWTVFSTCSMKSSQMPNVKPFFASVLVQRAIYCRSC